MTQLATPELIRDCDISKLKPYPRNPRVQSEEAVQAVRNSIEAFGFVNPIIVNKDFEICAGHTRFKAATDMGLEKIPVLVVPELTGDRFTGYNIADNQTATLTDFDDAELARLVADLQESESINIADLGFQDDELAEIMAAIEADKRPEEADPDDVPDPPVEPISKTGDLWLLSNHRLLCGDATKPDDVARLMNGQKADTCVTDPPYGIGYQYNKHDDKDNVANYNLVRAAFALAPEARVWTCGLRNLPRDLPWNVGAKVLCWHKAFAQAGSGLGGASTWEPVIAIGIHGGTLPNDYLSFSTDREPGLRELHSCPKPVALFSHLIEHLAGATIYDPFLGSGTTIIAAEQLGRRCYGMEIDPTYCDVSVKRWENFVGKKAELAT